MRVAIVYDCLYPYTVGGGERLYRSLAEGFAAEGHDVTYLTRRCWPAGAAPDVPGVRIVAVSPGGPLYTPSGRRRLLPPLLFGLGVLVHLLRHRGSYDAVHSCAFPFFSLLAARIALLGSRAVVAVDWFEVWTLDYWREYLGRLGGRIGHRVQRMCVRVTPLAFVFSELHARRLRDEGFGGPLVKLGGLYELRADRPVPRLSAGDPVVVFAGRLIREKRAHLIPGAIAVARRRLPELRAVVIGDGPEAGRVREEIAAHGLGSVIDLPGFVSGDDVQRALAAAACHVLPSAREGYGLVVVEAAANGTPSVVVDSPDNAAVELVEPGVNGAIASTASSEDLAAAIVDVIEGGTDLRRRTAAWFAERAEDLSVARSMESVLDQYRIVRRGGTGGG